MRYWTKDEDQFLEDRWGVDDIGKIAMCLDRTPTAVKVRAYQTLRLAPRGGLSLKAVSIRLGHNEKAIKRLAEQEGITLPKHGRVDPSATRRVRYSIDEATYELLMDAIRRRGFPRGIR